MMDIVMYAKYIPAVLNRSLCSIYILRVRFVYYYIKSLLHVMITPT
jgi:hypothetical protein